MLIESLDENAEAVWDDDSAINSHHFSVKWAVGASARLLFYPTLFYNVLRNKLEPEFRWWDEIEQFLLLGAVPFTKDVLLLKSLGVEAVITLNEPYETLVSSSLYKSQMIKHLVISTQDYLFAPSFDNIQQAVDFIHENVEQRKAVYVHCKAGRARSTTIVLCYLVKYRQMSPSEAFQLVQSKRPRVSLAASQWKAVLRYNQYLQQMDRRSLVGISQRVPLYISQRTPLHMSPQGGVKEGALCQQPCCGELLVVLTLADLEGYEEEATNANPDVVGRLYGLGLVYQVGIMTTSSFAGIAKASVMIARLSYIWLRYHQTDHQSFNVTLMCGALSSQSTLAHHSMVSVNVCQQ